MFLNSPGYAPAVRRTLSMLPYFGFALVVLALMVRAFRDEGLDLPAFPSLPSVDLPDVVIAAESQSLAGTVVDEAEQPIAEALVMIDLGSEFTWAYTDEQGAYRIDRLPAGESGVIAMAREYTTRRFRVAVPSEDLVLNLGPRVPPPPTLPDLTSSALEGEVIAAIAGRGLTDYEVQLIPVDPAQTLGAPAPERCSVGANRAFHFPDLIHGEYRVAILPPWARGGSWPNLCAADSRLYTHSPATTKLVLPIAAGEIAGTVIDSHGDFVMGALIRAHPEATQGRPWIPVQSDAEGAFLIRDLPPGTYLLQATAGEAYVEELVQVLSRTTSVLDLPPLDVRH